MPRHVRSIGSRRTFNLRDSGVLTFAGACLLAACGGSSTTVAPRAPMYRAEAAPQAARPAPTTVARASGDQSATAWVGAPGGELTLGNGARLEIPAGSLAEPVEVVFSLGEEVAAFRNREDERTVGPALVVSPEIAAANGARFVVELPFTTLPEGFTEDHVAVALERHDEDSSGFYGGATRTTWEHAPARVVSGRKLRAELPVLPGLRVQFVVSN
jgi:hypothetical protein